MSAIPAASAGVRDMADGSLRITLEFEPRHAKDAYAIFGSRGTPVAIAALKVGYAAAEPEKPKGGPLSKEAAALCRSPVFHKWLNEEMCMDGDASEETAPEWIRQTCGVLSRAELDAQPTAGQRFIDEVRLPFMHWTRKP